MHHSERRASDRHLRVPCFRMRYVCFQTTKSVAMLQSQNIKAEQRFLERADENDKMLAATSILHANMRSEERAEDRRMLRHMTLEKRERDMEESIMKVSRWVRSAQISPVRGFAKVKKIPKKPR